MTQSGHSAVRGRMNERSRSNAKTAAPRFHPDAFRLGAKATGRSQHERSCRQRFDCVWNSKFQRPDEKIYLKRSVDCALRPVKQREDYSTRKPSDHKAKKDSANFWIHIQVSSLERSVESRIAAFNRKSHRPVVGCGSSRAPVRLRSRGDRRRHSGGSLRKPT